MGVVGGLFAMLAMLLGQSTVPTVWRACPPVTWSVEGGVASQHQLVAGAVAQVAAASGQRYLEVDAAAAELTVIIWGDRASSRYLRIDGTADDGYTQWLGSTAGIDLLIGRVSTPLVLHELMLSRHLVERADPGGLLGHVVPNLPAYPAQDLAMLAAGSCV